MKKLVCTVSFMMLIGVLQGQETTRLDTGMVSFQTTQYTYVKFTATGGIQLGDTLYSVAAGKLAPALLVINKSSTSCVCKPLEGKKVQLKDVFLARVRIPEPRKEGQQAPETVDKKAVPETARRESVPVAKIPSRPEPQWKGRLSAASYSSFSGYGDLTRLQYASNFQARNLARGKLSADGFINFRHTLDRWQEVRDNLGSALKVYAFSLTYMPDSTMRLSLGRRFNNRISSLGAMDGLQFEKDLKRWTFGILAGSRPDPTWYGLDLNLFEYGAYLSFRSKPDKTFHETTFGFIDQQNHFITDRRLLYLQHTSNPLKDLSLYASSEIDLYEKPDSISRNIFRLSNLFVSLRYRVSRKLSLNGSYDARKNIIYYESYKSFLDRLIENETRQGLRFGFSYNPWRLINIGTNASWRFQADNLNESKNLNVYFNVTRVPGIKAYASLSVNFLETGFLKSNIYGLRLSRDLLKNKLNSELYYRYADLTYLNGELRSHQHIAGANLSVILSKKLSFFVFVEGTLDERNELLSRINTKIIERF